MMIVDNSVWIGHFRCADAGLQAALESRRVLGHPFIIGELALGHLRPRDAVIALLQHLPQAVVARDAEMLAFIDQHCLHGLGIGYVDAHLLASARLTAAALWTRDKKLHHAADRLGLAAQL